MVKSCVIQKILTKPLSYPLAWFDMLRPHSSAFCRTIKSSSYQRLETISLLPNPHLQNEPIFSFHDIFPSSLPLRFPHVPQRFSNHPIWVPATTITGTSFPHSCALTFLPSLAPSSIVYTAASCPNNSVTIHSANKKKGEYNRDATPGMMNTATTKTMKGIHLLASIAGLQGKGAAKKDLAQ